MIKSCTDIKQSKTLAEILSHKTADNTYERVVISGCNLDIPEEQQYIHKDIPFTYFSGVGVPCWSLAALLEVMSSPILIREYDSKWSCMEITAGEDVGGCENSIDACYEMILELHEQKLL